MVYFVPIVLAILMAFIYDFHPSRKQGKWFCYVVLCVILILIATLRYRVGGDTIRYMEEFKHYPELSSIKPSDFQIEGVMPLCLFFFAFCKSISSSFYFVQFVHSTIINITIFHFFKQRTSFIFSSALFYMIWSYLEFNTEIIRESLAVCVILWGSEALIKKRWLKYYLFCFIALGFHISAVVSFFLPLFNLMKWKFKYIFVCLIIVVIFSIVYQIMPDYFTALGFLGSDAEVFFNRYYHEEARTGNLTSLIIYASKWIILPIACIICIRWGNYRSSMNYVGLIMYAMVVSYFIDYSYGFYRFINYVMPYMWILLGSAMVSIPTMRMFRHLRSLYIIFSMAFIFYASLSINLQYMIPGKEDMKKYFPYTSIFNEEKVYRPEW